MNYKIVYPNELYHHGVKGMKWGVRRKQDSSGKLTEKGYSKYYTNGKLNRRGRKAQKEAKRVSDFANASSFGRTMGWGATAIRARGTMKGQKVLSDMIHMRGNMKITAMDMSGASYQKRKAVAGAHIAAIGAVKVASIAPYAAGIYKDTRYRHDASYANKINTLANLSPYEKSQRKKK